MLHRLQDDDYYRTTADVNRKTGRIYVGWEDGRFRKDAANDAVVTWSLDDQYQTWHRLKRVNPGPRADAANDVVASTCDDA